MDVLELRLQEAEERYRSLCDALPEMVWIANAQGFVTYANSRCLAYTGLSTQEKYGDGWIATIHPADLPAVREAWVASMQTGEPFQGEYRIRRHDGEFRWFLGKAVAVRRGGSIDYWIGAATDIETQKRTAEELRQAKEQAESANRAKSTFLAHMSHEIRTPLSAILGYATLLKVPTLEPETREQFIDIMIRNGKGLTRVIDDILDLAKVEAGRLDFEPVIFSMRDLTQECANLFAATCQEKGISLEVLVAPDFPPYVQADASRVRQILLNLIGNAVKFTSEGGVKVTVQCHPHQEEQLLVAVEVEDTGCGLSSEQVGRLFQPFTQGDATTSRRFGGTGLGLALSRRLSQGMGGNVQVIRAVPAQGCTFLVTFLATPAGEPSGEDEVDPPPAADALAGRRILLVEDMPDNRMMVARFLEGFGALVKTAGNGHEALQQLDQHDFDVVLMDIQMPLMDGYQALARLRDRGHGLPVLALTAHATLDEQARTREAGFAGHLTKPLNVRELVRALQSQPI